MATKNISTDTDDALRVTITLRRESNPEWYYRLKNIQSGRARAEILRSHLNLPRQPPSADGIAPLSSSASINLAEPRPTGEIPLSENSGQEVSSIKSTGYIKNESVNYKNKNVINTNETVDYKKLNVISRPCKIRFSKSTLHGVTKNQFFDDHASDPIARSRSPYAPSRII